MQVENSAPEGTVQPPAGMETKTEVPKTEPVETKATETPDDSDFFQKVKKEKDNWRSRAQEAEQRLKSIEEAEMRRKGQFEEMLKMKEEELNEYKTKVQKSQELIVNKTKADALKTELSKLGLDTRYHDKVTRLVDLKDIDFDTETKTVTNQEFVAKKLYEEFTPLFSKSPVGTAQGAPSGEPGSITIDDWKKMSREDKIKYRPLLNESLGLKMRK